MKNLTIALLMIILLSCDDIFEKDLESKQVGIITPQDSVVAPVGEMSFLWKSVKGATGYHLTVVSPSFKKAAILVADTIMMTDSISEKLIFKCPISAGDYQWNIRAINSAYISMDKIQTFFVEDMEPVEP